MSTSLISQISEEKQIGKLKKLVGELNWLLEKSGQEKVGRLQTFSLSNIEQLRELALKKSQLLSRSSGSSGSSGSSNSSALSGGTGDVYTVSTITELKGMARVLGMYGFSKYRSEDKEILRQEIIKFIKGARGTSPAIRAPPVHPNESLRNLTVLSLRELARSKNIHIRSKALKDEIIAALQGSAPSVSTHSVSTHSVSAPSAPSVSAPSAPSVSAPSGQSLRNLTVLSLRELARSKNIYIRSKALKDEIIAALQGLSVPSAPSVSAPSVSAPSVPLTKSSFRLLSDSKDNLVCTSEKISVIKTSTRDDLKNIKFDSTYIIKPGEKIRTSVKNVIAFLELSNPKKLSGESAGSYSETYFAKYRGMSAICKIVDFDSSLPYVGFQWELIGTERASKIGIGPMILNKTLGVDVNGTPVFGVLILSECTPLGAKQPVDLSDEECEVINEMIQRLHQNGIVHRDLSPLNIMRSGRRLVFIDYGLALIFDGPVPEEYRIFDYAQLCGRYKQYLQYMKKNAPASPIPSVPSVPSWNHLKNFIENGFALESLTAKYFPREMYLSLGQENSSLYMNNVPAGTKEDIIINRQLKARFV